MNLKIMDSDSVRSHHPLSDENASRDLSCECNVFGHVWHLRLIPAFWFIMSFIIVLTISLGFWQLDRMKQKQALISAKQMSFIPKTINGRFTGPRLYLDNITNEGKVGYEIIEVFQPRSPSSQTKPLLINRGWIAATANRKQLPPIPQPPKTSERSDISILPEQWSTRDPQSNIEPFSPSVFRIQALNKSAQTTLDLPSEYYRIQTGATALMTEHWQAQSKQLEMSPKRHLGYAMQWFSISVVAIVILLISSIRRLPLHSDESHSIENRPIENRPIEHRPIEHRLSGEKHGH